ncbi:TRAP transporter, DctM subunit [Lentibacillus persicus]|uniref:TRAP transporter, DctM subunit n=1 Tax=Lentibacillus persicus TaxID=640948 RepID=A0A1I1VY26_9BACI|nr:TRAP transporter large permease [Lentibacillus persicus]SFD87669.1 TRAP transporter, DctM subunit [Lentibacillus persicus]
MGTLIIYGLLFLVFIAISMPIAFSLGLSTLAAFFMTDQPLDLFAQRLWTGLDKFTLVAIPLFILAGELMGGSGILQRLLDFARLIVGRIKGGLLYINVLVSMLFGGINGSAVADTSAVGSMLIPATKKEYKDAELAAAVTSISSVVGPVIPPSLPMLIYVFAAGNVSVAAIFLAGVIPGILLGLSMMIITYVIARKKDFPKDMTTYTGKDVFRILRRFLVAAILPFIMVAGIVGGVVTPTEAGCLGVVYALVVGFFITKELSLKETYRALSRTVIVTAIVMIMISVGNVAIWWLSIQGIPAEISTIFQSLTQNPAMFMLLMVILYLFIGLFIEQAAAMIMLVPIFAPLATTYGIDPIHFGLITVLTLGIGLVTPPVGICLFVASSIADVKLQNVFKTAVPYLVGMAIVLVLVAFVPGIYLWFPKMFGF